jgi:hypothetical protein
MERKPKSALEIAMAKLDAADREAGVVERPLSDRQKQEIADVRQVFAARIAEREILLHDSLRKTFDPDARAKLEEEFQIDRRRHESDRDREIERIRSGSL